MFEREYSLWQYYLKQLPHYFINTPNDNSIEVYSSQRLPYEPKGSKRSFNLLESINRLRIKKYRKKSNL